MSENVNTEGINININNNDTNNGGGGSFLDRIFDIGLKLIIPLGLIIGLVVIVVLVRVVLPLVNIVGELDIPLGFLLTGLGPIGVIVGGIGSFAGWLIGR
mgnify:CR=1 FL=1